MATTLKCNQIVRIYEVILIPDAAEAYDAFSITLSWPETVAQKIDRDDPAVLQEAFERACKVERRDHHTPDEVVFSNGGVTCIREHLVPAGKTR